MSGDHNMYQKPRSYLDDFECPRCGHCCNSDLARVGEVGVWGEWQGLTDEEHDRIKLNYHNMTWTLEMFARAIEQALREKNT